MFFLGGRKFEKISDQEGVKYVQKGEAKGKYYFLDTKYKSYQTFRYEFRLKYF